MRARGLGRRAIPILIGGALLRLGALGCVDPEAFRLRGGVAAGAAGSLGLAGTGVAGMGVAGTGALTGVAGDGSTGVAGTGALAGQGGAAGADISGAAGVVAGAGGAGMGGTTGAAGDAGQAGMGGAAGGAGATGAAGSGGGAGATGQGGAGGKAGGAGGGSGGAAGGAAGAGGAGGVAGTGAVVDYCDRTHWTAKASVTTGDGAGPPGGIDGDLTTRWGSNHGQNGTDFYTVDFGGTVKLTKITLNNTQAYPDDYPGNYAVYGSSDGTTFDATPFVTGAGATGSTVITFTQRSVRAVRVNQTGTSRSTNWWQIGEFQVVCTL